MRGGGSLPMKPRSLAAMLLIAVCAIADARTATRQPARIYDPARDPARDLDEAFLEARRDGKRILLEVGGNWCGWCQEFERFVHADARVREALECTFVVVRVNVSPENGNERFLSRYPEVPGYPYFFVLDQKGSVLAAVDTDDFLGGEAYRSDKVRAFARRWSSPD